MGQFNSTGNSMVSRFFLFAKNTSRDISKYHINFTSEMFWGVLPRDIYPKYPAETM